MPLLSAQQIEELRVDFTKLHTANKTNDTDLFIVICKHFIALLQQLQTALDPQLPFPEPNTEAAERKAANKTTKTETPPG